MKRILVVLLMVFLLSGCAAPSAPLETTIPDNTTIPLHTETSILPETTADDLPPEPFPEPEDSDLVRIIDHLPLVRQQLAYATEDNFTGMSIYHFTGAYLRYGTVKKLALVSQDLEPLGIGLLIWDGFRPVSAQAALWEVCPDPTFVSHPETGARVHCRGNAVDLTLVDLETGIQLEMPTGFDDFTSFADRDYSECTQAAAENAQLLEILMEKHGFKPYSAEWWHYTDTQDYPVEESFDPSIQEHPVG